MHLLGSKSQIMSHKNILRLFVVVLVAACTFFVLQRPTSAENPITTAWQLAQARDSYRYRSQIEQTVYPAPRLSNVGKSAEHSILALDGAYDSAERTLDLTLWNDLTFDPDTGLAIRVDGDETLAREPGGEWEPVENMTSAFAPASDPLAWLAGVENLRTVAANQYEFDLDGAAVAEHVRQMMQELYREQGKLRNGMTLDVPSDFDALAGTGQLTVDASGLPTKLTLNLELPANSERGRAIATIESDFYDYAAAGFGLTIGRLSLNLLTSILPVLLGLTATTLLGVLFIRVYQTPAFYRVFSYTIILSMVLPSLFHGRELQAFSELVAPAQAEQPDDAPFVLPKPEFDPNRSPIPSNEVADLAAPPQTLSVFDPSVSTTDTDGDGLADSVEFNQLTTLYDLADSDADGLKDGLEVNGFSYNGKMWHTNPNEMDSNKDGLTDAFECEIWVEDSADYNPTAPCPDTDGDGTPDVWDDDNDNDGVVDAVDTSPFDVSADTYTRANPLEIEIDGLQADKPVFFDLQLRPTNAAHLYYNGVVLDWPSNDTLGQIQRVRDTTFATTDNLDLRSSSDFAANGDVRALPLLEIRIPYTDGHYGNLPIKTDYQNTPRTVSMTVDEWIDQDKLAPYGIVVRDADDGSGDLYIYLPLGNQIDDTGGGRAAFTTRMLYWPQQTGGDGAVNWAAAHEYRVQWMMQMITDSCVDPDEDPATCTRQDSMEIIHVYDEAWKATGVQVREDHGLDVAIAYENPQTDSDLAQDQDLWVASWNLNNNFINGRDCNLATSNTCVGDGQRDVTISNLDSSINAWSGGADSIDVETFSYDHRGMMAHVSMTETVSILNDVFLPASVITPTLLFANEEQHRTMTLGNATFSDNNITIDAGNTPMQIDAAMSWGKYEYVSGAWEYVDAQRALDMMKLQIQRLDFLQPADDSQESADEVEGKLLFAELYFSALYGGIHQSVELGDDPLWDVNQEEIPFERLEAAWPAATFTGFTYVGFQYLYILLDLIGTQATFAKIAQDFKQPYYSQTLLKEFPKLQTTVSVIVGVTTVAVVVGAALFAYGFLFDNGKLQRKGEMILNATTIATTSIALTNLVVGIRAALQAGQSATAFVNANKAFGAGTILLQLAVAWGSFAYFAGTSGLFDHPNGIPFNMALAYAVAQTIVVFIFFVISLIPIAGQIIVLLIYLTEAILSFFDIPGAQGALTQVLADSLYDVDFIIRNLDDPERLDFNMVNYDFADQLLGYTEAQSVNYTVDVTNTLKYNAEHGASEAKKSTFRYFVQGEPIDHHEDLDKSQMVGEWDRIDHRQIRTTTTAETGLLPFANVGTGINRSLGGTLYLSEAYASPYVGCWTAAFGENTNCRTYTFGGSTHVNIGRFYHFDILPNTLSEFMSLSWAGDAFPRQADQDGDGLLIGVDPTGGWDGDGDTLSDYFELANGTNPLKADSDDDGMTDDVELRRGLNPNDNDADDDGLDDAAEWDGWAVGYVDENGVGQTTWGWPSPFAPDIDEDTLDDEEERIFGLHPRVSNNPDSILDTIQFTNGTVIEQDTPNVLLRFEEPAGALTFVDNARNSAVSCVSVDGCPTAGEIGRYGRALSFDGTNDILFADNPFDPTSNTFTAALWFNVGSFAGIEGLIGQQNSNGEGSNWLYVSNTGVFRSAFGGGDFGSQTVSADTWHHAALTYDGNTATIYLDGVAAGSRAATSPNDDGQIVLGASWEETDFFLSGKLDDVVVYDRVLSSAELATLAAGRYNAFDNTVTPGAELALNMTITNTNPTLNAAVTYYGEDDSSFVDVLDDPPHAYISFDEPAGATSWAITYHGNRAYCATEVSGITCPTAGVAGVSGNAIEFTGSQIVKANNILSDLAADDGYTYAFWAKPYGYVANKKHFQPMVSFMTTGTQTNSDAYRNYMVYNNSDNTVWARSAPLDEWIHVAVTTDLQSETRQIYLNGVHVDGQYASGQLNFELVQWGRVYFGGVKRSDSSFYSNFNGVIDEFVYYERFLSPNDVARLYQGQHAQIIAVEPPPQPFTIAPQSATTIELTTTVPASQPAGSYSVQQIAEAALDIQDRRKVNYQPILRAHFDEDLYSIGGHFSRRKITAFPGTILTCNNGIISLSYRVCPTFQDGLAGESVTLNGIDQALTVDRPVNGGDRWSVSTWVKPTHSGASNVSIIGGGGFPVLYITSGDQLGLGFKDGTWNAGYSAGSIPRNEWTQVGATHDGAGNYQLYINGEPVGDDAALNNAESSSNLIGWIGHDNDSGYNYFEGQIDNVTVYDVTLNEIEMAALYSQIDFSLHLHLNFDEAPGSSVLTDLTGVFGDATCTNCPLLGIRNIANRGAYFDSNLVQTSIPNFWVDDAYDVNYYTFAAWLNVGAQGLIANATGINQPFRVWSNLVDGGAGTGGGSVFQLPANEWVHLVHSGSPTGGTYINGVPADEATTRAIAEAFGTETGDRAATTGTLRIGNSITGYIDDVRIYNRGLSQAEAFDLYKTSAPSVLFEFEESENETTFADTSITGAVGQPTNAAIGSAGRIGNGVTLGGDGYVTVTGADDNITDTLTVMAWIRPNSVDGLRYIFRPTLDNNPDGFTFGIDDGVLSFETFGNFETYLSDVSVTVNRWQHVAVVIDATDTGRMYLDGDLVYAFELTSPLVGNDDDPLLIGRYFDGSIDELTFYRRALTAAEIDAAYLNQFRWFRQQNITYLNVDTDAPTITLQTQQTHYADDFIMLAVSTEDASSSILTFEFGVQKPGESGLTWQGAAACDDAAYGKVWCPMFESLDEGEYVVQFRSADAVGNETTSDPHTLYVDKTGPTTAITTSGYQNAVEDEDGWLLSLAGSADDGANGSGAAQIFIELLDSVGNVVYVPQTAVITGTSWTIDYTIAGIEPHGAYSVRVTATDALGNVGAATVGAITLDERPPTIDALGMSDSIAVISQTHVFSGVVGEQPAWGGALATYHFASNAPLADNSGNGYDAACTACPTEGNGVFGRSLAFNGGQKITLPAIYADEDRSRFSIAFWVKFDQVPVLRQLIEPTTGAYNPLVFVNTKKFSVFFNNKQVTGGENIVADQWYHVVTAYDGATLMLFVDGELIASQTVNNGQMTANGFIVGGRTNELIGAMDELTFYDRALTQAEIVALAQSDLNGVASVEVNVTDFATGLPTARNIDTWESATLTDSNAQQSAWEYALDPSTIEGLHAVQVRGSDDGGNSSEEGVIWRGLIDGVAPQLTANATMRGAGVAAYTEYALTGSDFWLDLAASALPCDVAALGLTRYDDVAQPYFNEAYALATTCRVDGHVPTTDIELCDMAGNCNAQTVVAADATAPTAVTILTPTNSLMLIGNNISVPLIVSAVSDGALDSVSVTINGQPFGVQSAGQATNSLFDFGLWQPATSGAYTIVADMNGVQDTITVNVGLYDCLIETNGDNVTDLYSNDMQALQNGVDVAADGATIRVSGTCTGTTDARQTERKQLLHINKSITIDGGYDNADWSRQSDTATATLDALEQGHVVVIASGVSVTLTNLTVKDGVTSGSLNLGAGIRNEGALRLDNVHIFSNHGSSGGGGLYNTGDVVIQNSIISENSGGGSGSGLMNAETATMQVSNSIFRDNWTNWSGAAIHNANGGIVTVTHSTIVSNTADAEGGDTGVGAIYNGGGSVTLINSVVSGNNVAGDVNHALANCRVVVDGGYNVVAGANCPSDSGTTLVVDPTGNVLPLGGNSPVIDRIPAGTAGCQTTITTDKRGLPRNDLACDSGAYELQYSDSATVVIDDIEDGVEQSFGPTWVKLQRNGSADPGTITITKSPADLGGNYFSFLWTIEADVEVGLDIDVTICYAEDEIPSNLQGEEPLFTIYHRGNSAEIFQPFATDVDEAANCITANTNSFSEFAIGEAVPTAIELISFAASADENDTVTLKWETATEIDNAGFNLYRRVAGSDHAWEQINSGLIASKGQLGQGATYQYSEDNVPDGTWEYLLEDVDLNGLVSRADDAVATVQVGVPTVVAIAASGVISAEITYILAALSLLVVLTGWFLWTVRRRAIAQPLRNFVR